MGTLRLVILCALLPPITAIFLKNQLLSAMIHTFPQLMPRLQAVVRVLRP